MTLKPTRKAKRARQVEPTPHHDWIIYFGTDTVNSYDGETVLPADAEVFVVTKDAGKLHPKRMTVAEMIAAKDSADYPVMYRVA